MTDCDSCARIRTRDEGTAPLWDRVYRTPYWDVAHCYDTSLLGWMVVVSRRHVASVDALEADEAAELGALLVRLSRALKAALGCAKTYVMQFAEHPRHPHVHFHVVPRMPNLPAEYVGVNVFAYLGVAEDERVSDGAMNDLARTVGADLSASGAGFSDAARI